jgi:CDP-diacylglycerol--glycerol-3-phosphate 3-phosphatidyltransferase
MNYFIQSLTYFRILISPIIFLLITVYDSYGWALFLFFLASISDYWDGFLARKYKLESIIGAVLDPIADKILITFGGETDEQIQEYLKQLDIQEIRK